jgi:hypothetical protein
MTTHSGVTTKKGGNLDQAVTKFQPSGRSVGGGSCFPDDRITVRADRSKRRGCEEETAEARVSIEALSGQKILGAVSTPGGFIQTPGNASSTALFATIRVPGRCGCPAGW